MKKALAALISLLLASSEVAAQTKEAYGADETKPQSAGLLDPSRFTIHHAMSVEASSSTGSSLKSQSLYSTMITYKFAQPVTLNLNFSLPIFSTYNTARNLTMDNLKSMEYFKSMPYDVSLTWQPRENMLLQFSVMRRTAADYYSAFYSPYRYSPLDR